MTLQILYEFIIAILIGITQGITEFLPISSTAHMRIVAGLLSDNRDIGQATGNFIQLGTMVAVLYYFKKDLLEFWQRFWVLVGSHKERILFWNHVRAWMQGKLPSNNETNHKQYVDITLAQLVIATLPIAILGFLLRDLAKDIRDFYSIAGFLLFGSGLMAFSEYTHKLVSGSRKFTSPFYSLPEVVLIGLFQTLAIFPGVSRSGSTLAGTLMLGHNRPNAVRFSFLLSLPAITLAGLLSIYELIIDFSRGTLSILPGNDLFTETGIQLSVLALVVSVVFSYISGYVSLKWLLKYLSSNTFRPFILYRIVLVVFLVVLMLYGFGN
jgi:undecaprenyl-diphosphatase